MKKTIALLTALAMLAAFIPAMALTASAADVTAVVMSDGKTAYKLSGENLIADGSFESADWAKQLTVGKWRGSNGMSYTAEMNANPTGVWSRSTVAKAGKYSLTLINDSQNGVLFNDANKPASIKHYIKNDSSAAQKYYIGFYAKAVGASASFDFAAAGVSETAGIPADASATVEVSGEWTLVEKVVDVAANDYLLINVYNMTKNKLYLDDFVVYKVYSDADTKAFASAMSGWKFKYAEDEVVNSDVTLPMGRGDLKVTWSSSDPDVISETGAFKAPADDTSVTLTAAFSLNEFYAERSYRLKAEGFRSGVEAAVKASVPRTTGKSLSLIDTVAGYAGSTVVWASSDESVIAADGTYTAPASKKTVTLTATVTYNGISVEISVPVLTGVEDSLFVNGGFDLDPAENGGEIVGWTTGVSGVNKRDGGTAPMTTANFDYVTDETGNSYIVSKGHSALDSANSIRKYVDLTPGKTYMFSYKVWYVGSGSCQEFYTTANLVDSRGAEVDNYPAASYDGRLTKNDGWQTFQMILKPTTAKSTLLFAAKWLDKRDGRNDDGRWAFDDFVLQELDIQFYGDVTVRYLDAETGEPIKKERVEAKQIGNMTYIAPQSDKEDIVVGEGEDAVTYRYDNSSTDSVVVANEQGSAEGNVIELKFKKLVSTDVTVKFLDASTDESVKPDETITGYFGQPVTAPKELKVYINNGNKFYTYNKLLSNDTITVGEGENIITLYYNSNCVPNGDFSTGNAEGWTNRLGTDVTDATVVYDSALGCNVLSMATGGKTATNSIGTAWTVTRGTLYKLSFMVYSDKIDTNNFGYNRVSDAFSIDGTNRQNAGTDLVKYAENMKMGEWNTFNIQFTAETDTVYFQSSWVDNIKLANVSLSEVKSDFTTSVEIKYVDRATGEPLKAASTVSGLSGSNDGTAAYSATAADKADIITNGKTYVYDPTSVSTVSLKRNNNVITLYFNELAITEVESPVYDIFADDSVELPSTLKVTYNDGSNQSFPVEWDFLPEFNEGSTIKVKGSLVGADQSAEAVINVFYSIQNGAGSRDDYNWVTVNGEEYPIEKTTANLIPNANFTEGTTGWTNAADGGSIDSNWTVSATGNETNGSSINIINKGVGGAASGTMRTFFKVEAGKRYYVGNKIYNAGSAATANQSDSGMRALVATEGKGFGNPKTCGAKLYGIKENGGLSSWNIDGTTGEAATNYPIIGTMGNRDDGTYQPGVNEVKTIISVPSSATDPYIMISYGAWSNVNLYYSDFELYEIAEFGVSKASKVKVVVNGEEKESVLVVKGQAPDLSAAYPGCIIDASEVDTNKPNGGTVYITDPSSTTTLTFDGNKAVLKAVGEAFENVVAVVAQYGADGALISAETQTVTVADGASADIEFAAEGGAKTVKVMILESKESVKPLIRAAVKTL